MRTTHASVAFAGLVLALCAPQAPAQQARPLTAAPQPAAPAAAADNAADLKAIRRQLAAMQKLLNGMRTQLAEDSATVRQMQGSVEQLRKEVQAASNGVRALQANSILDLNGYITFDNSSGYPTVLFNGINVQIVNGTGATQTTNGLGNLIIGYNRARTTNPVCSLGAFATEAECVARGGTWARSHKSGSHNLVAGDYNAYSSWGGTVFGLENAATAPYAVVLGGAGNLAQGDLSSVTGGSLNTASGMYGSVTGGLGNTASGSFAALSGGNTRTAAGSHDWVAGGLQQDH